MYKCDSLQEYLTRTTTGIAARLNANQQTVSRGLQDMGKHIKKESGFHKNCGKCVSYVTKGVYSTMWSCNKEEVLKKTRSHVTSHQTKAIALHKNTIPYVAKMRKNTLLDLKSPIIKFSP